MGILAKELEPYKLRARRRRASMVKALETGDRTNAGVEFENALLAVEEGFAFLARYQAPNLETSSPAGEGESAVAEQLADLWGIKGGIYRSRGYEAPDAGNETDFDRAIDAYENGYKYESSHRFGILNSYNTVNRLVLRILRRPGLLDSSEPVPGAGKKMRDLLDAAAADIERQLEAGRTDVPWALADIAMIELLQGGRDIRPILDELENSTLTDPYPLQSMLNVLRDLLTAGVQPRERLIAAGEHLRSILPESMKGPRL